MTFHCRVLTATAWEKPALGDSTHKDSSVSMQHSIPYLHLMWILLASLFLI